MSDTRNDKARCFGGSSQRASRDCLPRHMARNARRGSHRPVLMTLAAAPPRRNRPRGPSLQGGRVRIARRTIGRRSVSRGNRKRCCSTACRCCCSRPRMRRWRRRVLPPLWRDRGRARTRSTGRSSSSSPAIAVAAGDLRRARRSTTGARSAVTSGCRSPPSLAALVPSLLLLARWRERAFVVGGIGRTHEAEERISTRDRELEAVAAISSALGRAHDLGRGVAAARAARDARCSASSFAGVAVVAESRDEATGVYGELDGRAADVVDVGSGSTCAASRPGSRAPSSTPHRSPSTTSRARRSSARGSRSASARRAARGSR